MTDGQPQTVLMKEWCPFLTCLLPVPHTHEVCPTCGAVRYGNIFCPTCFEHRPTAPGRMIHGTAD